MENVPPIRQAWRGCRASVLWLPLALSHATMQTTAPNASESDQKAFRHEVQVGQYSLERVTRKGRAARALRDPFSLHQPACARIPRQSGFVDDAWPTAVLKVESAGSLTRTFQVAPQTHHGPHPHTHLRSGYLLPVRTPGQGGMALACRHMSVRGSMRIYAGTPAHHPAASTVWLETQAGTAKHTKRRRSSPRTFVAARHGQHSRQRFAGCQLR